MHEICAGVRCERKDRQRASVWIPEVLLRAIAAFSLWVSLVIEHLLRVLVLRLCSGTR